MFRTSRVLAAVACLAGGAAGEGGPLVPRDRAAFDRKNPDLARVVALAAKAPPLPKPTGPVLQVRTAEALYRAVRDGKPGTTILLADGLYKLHRPVVIRTDGVSLRGASGAREKVVLDRGGGRKRRDAVVMIDGADDVLVANLTCRNCDGHGVQIMGHRDTQRTRVYNVVFRNIWTRGVKGTGPGRKYRDDQGDLARRDRTRPAGGEIRYCLFVNDRRKADADDGFRGDYVGGIDMMWLKDWGIADNVFVGIRGRNGVGRGAMMIWVWSEDVVAERNIIVNCDRGICFGNPSGPRPHMVRGIARNNFIVAGVSQGIEMARTVDTLVAHNTVVAASPAHPAAVQFHQGARGDRFVNNVVHGRVKMEKAVAAAGNVVGDCAGWFVDPTVGDLHLTEQASVAAGKARRPREVPEDFDRQKRKAETDVGADERRPTDAPPERRGPKDAP